MTFQLTATETHEYKVLKEKFFGDSKQMVLDTRAETDPDYHRYIHLNKKLVLMLKFWHRLNNAPQPLYLRIQHFMEKRYCGKWIRGYSPCIGLILE